MTPYYSDDLVRLYQGNAAHLPLADGSVDLVVTSPPYWALRSYSDDGEHYAGQVGSEATPAEYVAALLDCTREWMRVLKPQGSLFVNLGDKYAGGDLGGCQAKSLHGLPWRYAIGCIDDLGLILRAEIVWSKPNGLPESVTDRVRRSHEQVFHFTKSPRYFSAVDEVREQYGANTHAGRKDGHPSPATSAVQGARPMNAGPTQLNGDLSRRNSLGKLPGSVWEIPSQPLTVPASLGVDHFAAFPMELPRRCILGWSPPGICTACGEGRRPVTVAEAANTPGWALSQRAGRSWHGDGEDPKRALGVAAVDRSRRITGYACACPDATAPTRPSVVLDPFGGTGTTALVAAMHGRAGISVDRSADYCRLARWRVSDPAERARAMQVPKPPPVPEGQDSLFDMAVTA
jgi:DNA modification methylase